MTDGESEMTTWHRPRLANWWVFDPHRDSRFEGLHRITSAIEDAGYLAWGSIAYDRQNPDPSAPYIPSPLELATMLRRAAENIEALTAPDNL